MPTVSRYVLLSLLILGDVLFPKLSTHLNSNWLVGTRRTAPLYSEVTLVAPDGRTDFDP